MKRHLTRLVLMVCLVPGCFGRVTGSTDSAAAGGTSGTGNNAGGSGPGGSAGFGGDTPWDDTGPVPTGMPLTVAVRQHDACGLRADGSVACWGRDGTGAYTAAKDVDGVPARLHSVALGTAHGCVLTGHGSVFCWGAAEHGQNGGAVATTGGVELESLHGRVNQLSAAGDHSCVLDREGAVLCWGAGGRGQLGNGSFNDSSQPVQVAGLGGPALQVVAGSKWSCAHLESGEVKCWGAAEQGVLGVNVRSDRATPQLIRVEREVERLAEANGDLPCAILTDAHVRCWGSYSHTPMRVSYGDVGPILGFDEEYRVTRIATGGRQGCAVEVSGHVSCWIREDGPFWRDAPLAASDVSVGEDFTCARNDAGVWCWTLAVSEQNLLLQTTPNRIDL